MRHSTRTSSSGSSITKKAGKKREQHTLAQPVTIRGKGLHSGKECEMTLHPALPNRGIVFRRVDLPGNPEILAKFQNVVNTQLATTLGQGTIRVSMVEHLLAAFAGLGIDNCIVDVVGPEIPILDGSSAVILRAVESVGRVNQHKARTFVRIKKRVELRMGEKWAVVEPSEQFEIHASIEWDHPAIGHQEFRYVQGQTDFEEIAHARTFGFLRDVEMLQKHGLARGGSLETAVVLDDVQVINPEGLRYRDEFVRHKVLDALGDFQLAGISFLGKFRLHRAGHDLHSMLLQEIFKDDSQYEIVSEVIDSPMEESILIGNSMTASVAAV